MISKRYFLVLALALAGITVEAQTNYVFMYNDFIFGQSTSVSTDFIPNNCVYTGTSGSTFRNGNGYYIVGATNTVNFSQESGSNLTINNNHLYYDNTYYLRYSASANNNQGGWQFRNNYNVEATVYTVTTNSHINSFSISGDATISATGTNNSYEHTYAEYYDTYFFNNRTYNSTNPSVAASTAVPTSGLPTLTTGYTWSLSANSYATVNPTTGAITVNSLPTNDTDITLTCSVSRNGVTQTANKTITIEGPKVNPESISATSSVTVYVGTSGTVTYTLTPTGAYDNVTGTSSNQSIFTVGTISGGLATINPVAVGSATLTLTAHKINGDPITPSATVTVNVRNKVATPEITFTANREGTASTTITCATAGATIYYKVNDAASYTTYSEAFDVNENDEVHAYASMVGNPMWDDSDTETQTYVSCTTNTPIITYTTANSTATVTISAETGATIYYTTNGNDPTTSSLNGTTSVTINNVANGTVVKAFAKNSTCGASDIVTKTIIFSGISGDQVILNDLEDHSWSYYSDVINPIRSLNPADVKITYYGDGIMMTGNADYTASSTDYITSTHTDYKVGAKVNVGGENENTFIYYKTLERGDATQTSWTYSSTSQSSAASRCPYIPIPNPFQVRPRYGDRTVNGTTIDANDFTGWRGFQCWRLKSVTGGAVYSAASGGSALSTGAVINAETEIYFAPNAEYGMEVELEAVWARAYVKKANQASDNPVGTNNVGFERNFCVPTTGAAYLLYSGGNNQKRISNPTGVPVTISCYYPDGTAPDNTNNSISNAAVTLVADTKFENISVNLSSNTLTADNHYLCFGRGISSSVNVVRGSGGGTDVNHTLRIETGSIGTLHFVAQGGNVSGRVQVKATMGCDYDRAQGDNSKLSVSANSSLWFSSGVQYTSATNKDVKVLDLVVKSGEYQKSYWSGANADGQYNHSLYLGANSSGASYPGVRYATIEGGEFASMNGGRGTSNMNNASADVVGFYARVKNGTFNGSIFGGAADNNSPGGRSIIITGGTVKGWIAGGGNGTGTGDDDAMANTVGNSYIYIGGNATIGDTGSGVMTINETVGGQVFGAGRGKVKNNGTSQTAIVNNSYVVIADNSTISSGNNANGGNVYGGGNLGIAQMTANVYVLGGTVQNKVFGGAYGNANTGTIPSANVTMTGGLVEGGVYGGSNSTGSVGNVTMHIDGGTVGDGESGDGVYGGGFGQPTIVSGNVDLTLGTTGQTTDGVSVYGDVYGGSALGRVNGTTATDTYHTYVTMNKGTIHGALYGGALGDASTAANVYGPVQVIVNDGTVDNVFGCNNINGAPQRAVTVTMNGGEVVQNVYGGGNMAAYTFANGPVVVINGGTVDQDVFGGGNLANVAGNTHVTVNGGTIAQDVYGGGALADVGTNISNTTIVDILGGTIQRAVYGGGLGDSGHQAVVNGEVTVNIGAGTAGADGYATTTSGNATLIGASVYGGNNAAGTPKGNVTVNIWQTAHTDDNMQSNTNGSYAIANVFGGGNQSDYQPTLSGAKCIVHIYTCENTIGRTFGGGNAAAVPSATTRIDGGRIGNVFGGGNGELGASYGADVHGNVILDIHGGTVGEFYGGSNQNGAIHGSISIGLDNDSGCGLNINEFFSGGNFVDITGGLTTTIECSEGMEIANLYGGCNQANISGDVVLNVYGGIYTNVFGGSKGRLRETNGAQDDGVSADIDGNVTLNLYGGTIENVFGGSNVRGNIKGNIIVNVLDVEGDCPLYITNIYGGSNLTSYTPDNASIVSPLVNVVHAKYGISGNVYGGSKGLVGIPATVKANPRVNIGYDPDMIDNANNAFLGDYVTDSDYSTLLQSPRSIVAGSVYGGCDAAKVEGSTAVYLRNRSKVFGNVYGGGNMGEVTGDTKVILNGATNQ